MTESLTKREVIQIILKQEHCTESCPFSDECPRMLDAMLSEDKFCLIRLNLDTEAERFFNLYQSGSEGLKNEMRAAAYRIAQSACTPEETLSYFQTIQKMQSTFYAPEKTGKAEEITSVNIVFSDIGEKKHVKKTKSKKVQNP